MNCPACLSIMTNRDEIHKISPTKFRMNLHCSNYNNCPARTAKNPYYGPYMQVITNDPHPWECVKYGLIIMRNDKRILLEGDCGYDFTCTKLIENVEHHSPVLFPNIIAPGWKELRKVKYIQLSTGDDMHIQAIDLAKKLTKLIAFI